MLDATDVGANRRHPDAELPGDGRVVQAIAREASDLVLPLRESPARGIGRQRGAGRVILTGDFLMPPLTSTGIER